MDNANIVQYILAAIFYKQVSRNNIGISLFVYFSCGLTLY